MFRTEEQKMRLYKKNLKKEAENNFRQGLALQNYLDYEAGIEKADTKLDKFVDVLSSAIGKDSRDVKKIDKTLMLRSNAYESVPGVVSSVDESGVLLKNVAKKQPKSIKQPPKPKEMKSVDPFIKKRKDYEDEFDRPMEQAMMNYEDKLSKVMESMTYAITKKENSDMAAEDAISNFRELSDKQDFELRQKIMNELDKMIETANKKEKANILKLQDEIEKKRLEDIDYNKFQFENAVASKIQKNLRAAVLNKKINKRIVKKTMNDILEKVDEVVASDMAANKAAKTIQERMKELRAKKLMKRSGATSPTSVNTQMEVLDAREFNVGRPRINKVKRLFELENKKKTEGLTKKEMKTLANTKKLLRDEELKFMREQDK